jgi:hypothetical protein
MQISNSEIFMRGDFKFLNNRAVSAKGGVFFIENSTLSFSSKGRKSAVLFKDNSAAEGGDIYLLNSLLIFDAADFSISLTNGIRMGGSGKIIKTGAKELIFEGENSKLSDIEIRRGKSVFKSQISSVGFTAISSGAVLSLAGGGFNKLFTEVLVSSGALELDLDLSFQRISGDEIAASTVIINNRSFLTINPINRNTWVYGSSKTIVFANSLSVNISAIYYDAKIYKVFQASSGTLTIMYRGGLPQASKKFSLSHNQSEAYLSLKKFDDLRRNGRYGAFGDVGDNFEQEMNGVISDVWRKGSEKEIKKSLDSLSGSFLAQTIVHTAMDNPHKTLYSKAKPFSFAGLESRDKKARSLRLKSRWGDLGVKISQTDNANNMLGTYKMQSLQASAGGAFIESADILAGVFANLSKTQMKQGLNDRADVQNFEGGVYGGLFGGYFEHKYFASMGYHYAATNRRVELNRGYVPKANFDLYSFKGGAESSLPLALFDETDVRLFGGLTAASVYNEKIKERGGSVVGLTIVSGFYNRLDGYAGLKIGRRNWHISAEFGYLLYGNSDKSRFGMYMDGLYDRMDTEGSSVDPMSFGLSFGTDKRITKDFYLQTLGGFSADKDLGGKRIYLNIGVKYLLPTAKDARVYREMQRKYMYTKEERLKMARRGVLIDKHTGWTTTNLKMSFDSEEEVRIRSKSYGKNTMVVHVLIENENGDFSWMNFMIKEMSDFPKDSEAVSPKTIKLIREKMASLDESKTPISRVRIVRYGRFIDEKEAAQAKRRAENIYKEMRLYRDEIEQSGK